MERSAGKEASQELAERKDKEQDKAGYREQGERGEGGTAVLLVHSKHSKS